MLSMGDNMTPDEFEKEMRLLMEIDNVETRHKKADRLMCEVLNSLEYGVGVKLFQDMYIWYG